MRANLTKYGAKNSLIGDHGIYNLESCYDFGIRVYDNNTFNYELYWFSWCAKHTMKWIKLNPDNNDVIDIGIGGPDKLKGSVKCGELKCDFEPCPEPEPEPEPDKRCYCVHMNGGNA